MESDPYESLAGRKKSSVTLPRQTAEGRATPGDFTRYPSRYGSEVQAIPRSIPVGGILVNTRKVKTPVMDAALEPSLRTIISSVFQ